MLHVLDIVDCRVRVKAPNKEGTVDIFSVLASRASHTHYPSTHSLIAPRNPPIREYLYPYHRLEMLATFLDCTAPEDCLLGNVTTHQDRSRRHSSPTRTREGLFSPGSGCDVRLVQLGSWIATAHAAACLSCEAA